MSGPFLFEVEYRNRLWRLQPTQLDGEWRLNFWAWFRSGDGWRPCKGNEVGCVVPQGRLAELADVVGAFAASLPSRAPDSAS